jgi:hypothetical protein
LRQSPKSMNGSQIHLALAHWKWHTLRVEKLSKALEQCVMYSDSSIIMYCFLSTSYVIQSPQQREIKLDFVIPLTPLLCIPIMWC